MAELFLADDTTKGEQVVIKRILPYLSHEPEFVQMFLDEARIAAQLHHPNIITVYELGKLQESIFIAMEYVDGVDLRKIFQEELKAGNTLPYGIAAYVTAMTCAGLGYAHNATGMDGRRLEVIHRDVSPQNVMVGFDSRVKLVDFGIAKAGALMERSKPGVIKGKFLYLSPEQLSQDRVDHRADLFAVGSMLYELTTGKSPFYKPTTEAVIYAIRAEEPAPPTTHKSDYPPELARIVMKCLVKDRTKRYQQADEIRADLEAFLAKSLPTDAKFLQEYVRKLLGRDEDNQTRINVSKKSVDRPPEKGPSGRKEATQELPGRKGAPSSTGVPAQDAPRTPSSLGIPAAGLTKRPTTTTGKPIADPGAGEARTKLAGPDELPRAMSPIAAVPSRKASGAKYIGAGQSKMPEPSITHETLDESEPAGANGNRNAADDGLPAAPMETGDREAEMTLPPLPEGQSYQYEDPDDDQDESEQTLPLPAARPAAQRAPARSTPPPPGRSATRGSGVKNRDGLGKDDPVFDTGPVPSRDEISLTPIASQKFQEGDSDEVAARPDATVSEAPRSRQRRGGPRENGAKEPKGRGGMIAAVVIVLLAIGAAVAWWMRSKAPAPVPVPVQTRVEPTPPLPTEVAPPPPENTPTEPPPGEPITPSTTRLTLVFEGQPGTTVTLNGRKVEIGERVEADPGVVEYSYRCPDKRSPPRKETMKFDASSIGTKIQINLNCRR